MGRLFQLVDDLVNERIEGGVYEILLDGPSGTGKTKAALELIRMVCRANRFHDVRVLIARKTLKSMRDTTLVEWESTVLLPTELPRSKRASQTPHYSWEETGAEVVCGGFDDPAKILSGQYDIIFFNEGKEITKNDYETALTRMRNGMLNGWHLVIIDTNPDAPTHWLNQRAKETNNGLNGMMRIKNQLDDNPRWVDQETKEYTKEGNAYLGIMDRLTGVHYRRYRLGEWCMAEGAIWKNYDPEKHLLTAKSLTQRPIDKKWQLCIEEWGPNTIELDWFFAGVDWGYRAPGSMLIFGVDREHRAFLVEEHYMTGDVETGVGDKVWWAERAEEARKKWDVQRFICDNAEPDSISLFNRRMGKIGGYWIAEPCKKQKLGWEASFSCVRERFANDSIFFLRDTLVQVDSSLKEKSLPTCLVDEIPAFEYKESKDGQPTHEEPRIDGVDHGCSALRYSIWWLDHHDWGSVKEVESAYPVGSYGRLMGHDKIFSEPIY